MHDVHTHYKQNICSAIQPNFKILNEFGIKNNHIFINVTTLIFSWIFQNQGPSVSMLYLALLYSSPIFMTCSFKYHNGIKYMVQNGAKLFYCGEDFYLA